ncbi:hypothetical protein FI667_g703, partial [Globisporangium splendens]
MRAVQETLGRAKMTESDAIKQDSRAEKICRLPMSDFTNDEDRQVVQLALAFAVQRKTIAWERLAALMSQSTHSKDALRQRLKTLKRTHGTDLRKFPAWFFRKCYWDIPKRNRDRKSTTLMAASWPPSLQLLASVAIGESSSQSSTARRMQAPTLRNKECLRSEIHAVHAINHCSRGAIPRASSPAIPSTAAARSQAKQHRRTSLSSPPSQQLEEHDKDSTDDPIWWLINRLSCEEVKPHELATIEKLFAARDDTPLLMKWVLLSSAGKFHKRLIVISAFRMWMLKRKKPFKTQLVCCKELQLMRIQKIRALCGTSSSSCAAPTTSIQLVVSQNQFRHPPVVLHFDPGVHTESVVRLLQRLLHGLRLVLPDKQFPKVHLPSKCHWEEFFAPSDSNQVDRTALVEAMTTAYRAFCDDLNVRYRPTITTRLIECVGSSVDSQYCLSFPPGVDGYQQQPSFIRQHLGLSSPVVDTSIQLREVQALARTLEHCHCFDRIVVYDLSMNEIGMSALFQGLLSPHSSISAFTLTNVDLSARSLRILQNVVLQSTIKRAQQKQSLQLKRLDFSFNKFSPAMAVELSIMLELLPSGLEVLQLEQCRLSSPSSSRILQSVKSNTAFSSCLRQLNLSGNQLGHEGSRILSSWITGAFALHCLDLSQTKLSMNVFLHALRQNSILHESSLRVVDLSYNRMRTQASKDLGWILGKTQSLSTLFLRGMQHQSFHPSTMKSWSRSSRDDVLRKSWTQLTDLDAQLSST